MDTDVLQQDAQAAWADLRAECGDVVRVVARYNQSSFETVMRDDVRARYTPPEDQEIIDQVILSQLSSRKLDESFKEGDLQSFIEVFENAWVVIFPDDLAEKSGFIVSLDRDTDISTSTHAETTIQYFNTRDATPPE